jgi:glucose/mannose transport system permease protein
MAATDTSVPRAQVRATPRRRGMTTDQWISLALITPSIILIAIFVYGFIGRTAYVSLVDWTTFVPDFTWVGPKNYLDLFQDERFRTDIRNTIVFTTLFITSCLAIGLTLATLLDSRIRGEALWRNIYMFPLAISFIVTGVAWRWLESPSSGLNLLFENVGLGFLKSGWFTDPNIGIIAVVPAATWQMSGYIMAMYLAGLRGIPEELREAARVDGATELEIFRHIILPLLAPITLSAVIILGHISLKIFDLTKSMTGPGPAFSSDVPALYMYETTFFGSNFSRGASIAMVMLVLVSVLIIPYLIYNVRTETHS